MRRVGAPWDDLNPKERQDYEGFKKNTYWKDQIPDQGHEKRKSSILTIGALFCTLMHRNPYDWGLLLGVCKIHS